MHKRATSFYQYCGKRLLDISLVIFMLPLLVPCLLLIGFIVYRKLGRPILFIQNRPGKYGKIFRFYKFRTMRGAYDTSGKPLPDAQRMVSFGKKLRATSLDELPSLYNVLKGDMSLVGPRPLLPEYLPLYTKEQNRRHEVRPGITGLAQINGRNTQSWEERFNWDLQYVNSYSFLKDIGILWRTIWKVLQREGITAKGHTTMQPLGEYLRDKQAK